MSRYNPHSCRCNPGGACRCNPDEGSFPWATVLITLGAGTMLVLGVQALTKKPPTVVPPTPPVPTPNATGPVNLATLARAIDEVEHAPAGAPQISYKFQPASGMGGERDAEDALDLLT